MDRSSFQRTPLVFTLLLLLCTSCTSPESEDAGDQTGLSRLPQDSDAATGWTGTMDTPASGTIAVHNAGTPHWSPEDTWQVVERLRIGSDTDSEAILFGHIRSFDVDAEGRVYVLDGQAQEIHIFDADGTLIRTAGTQGTGPGEFERAGAVDISPNGEIWVMEMAKGRLTALDSDGMYLRMEYVNSTGWDYLPYPGGMDRVGRYNGAVLANIGEDRDLALARFDASFAPLDTVAIPENPVEYDYYELLTEDGASISAAIPYQGSFQWRFSLDGNFWTLYTRTYELAEVTPGGKVLRTIGMEFEPIPVTTKEREEARDRLQWFTRQGGKVDMSRIPNTRPVVTGFFVDDIGSLWVQRVALESDDEGRLFDVFDADGRFLGGLRLPFALNLNPVPVVIDGVLYGTGEDAEGAATIVVASIERPDE